MYVCLALAKEARTTKLKINNPTPSATELWLSSETIENTGKNVVV